MSMEPPRDINEYLRKLHEPAGKQDFRYEDEVFLQKIIAAIRSGQSAVLLVDDGGEQIKYMICNADRPVAAEMLSKVNAAIIHRWRNGDAA